MGYCTSLFLFQLTWLLGAGQTANRQACTVIAIVINYLVLTHFAWSSVVAYHTYKLFSSNQARFAGGGDIRKSFMFHLLLVHLVPFVWLGVFFCLDVIGVMTVGFGSNYACLVSELNGAIATLIIPLAIIIVFNFINFTRTVLTIRQTQSLVSRTIQQNNPSHVRLLIYIKLMSLMGFTWVTGFISLLHDSFWYLFVVLNGLQGFYVAMAFVCTKKVWNMYSTRFKITRSVTRVTCSPKLNSKNYLVSRSIEETRL